MVIDRGWESGNEEIVFIGDRVSVWDEKEVLEMDHGDGGTTI